MGLAIFSAGCGMNKKTFIAGLIVGFLLGPCCKSRNMTSPTVIKTYATPDERTLSDANMLADVKRAEFAKSREGVSSVKSGPGWEYK